MNYFVEGGFPTFELLIFSVFFILSAYFLANKSKYKLPPGPRGLPLLGYLPFLGDDPCVELVKLSKKYGDIFSLHLGKRYAVVVTDVIKAKKLLNKRSTSDRAKDLFFLLPGGEGFGEMNGRIWTEQRRYSIKQLKNLGFGRSYWEELVKDEVADFLDILKASQGKPKDVFKELSASMSNNVLALLSGHKLPAGHPKRNIIDQGIESHQLIHIHSGLVINYPRLFMLCVRLGLIDARQKMKDIQNMSNCIREEIEDLKHKDGDFYIQKYYTEIEQNKRLCLENSFDEDMLLGNVQLLVIAGSDTTKVSLLWLFLAMAAFPHIQEKVHEEIDKLLGKDGKVNWMNRRNLPYCYSTILEAQRWRSVIPLNLMHRTNEDISIDGYVIPSQTDIMFPIHVFHNDTRYWKNPDDFQPERFIAEDGKITELEAYMPFSHGKRICPGKTVALVELFYYFVGIMQKFRILPPSESTQLDLVGITGLALHPKRQLLRYVWR